MVGNRMPTANHVQSGIGFKEVDDEDEGENNEFKPTEEDDFWSAESMKTFASQATTLDRSDCTKATD